MVNYRVVITDLSNNQLGELIGFKDLTFKKVRNREGDCTVVISVKNESLTSNLIQLGQRDMYIYRNDDIVWGGRLMNYSGMITGGDDVITLVTQGFFALLKKRYTSLGFTNTDAGNIAWGWINANNPGFTLGTIVPSGNHDRNPEYGNIYEEIIQLTEIKNGIDVEVTQTKVFNSYFPQGTDKSADVVFSWGKNIDRIEYSNDFSDPVNQAIVLGGGFGDAMIVETRNNTALQADYGLQQETIPYKNVEETALLQAKGDKEIIRRGLPRRNYKIYQTPETDPEWTSLVLGDWVRTDVDYGCISIHDAVRINSIEVTYRDGVEYPAYSFIYD